MLSALLIAAALGAAVLFTARPRLHRWKKLTLPRATADGSDTLRMLALEREQAEMEETVSPPPKKAPLRLHSTAAITAASGGHHHTALD